MRRILEFRLPEHILAEIPIHKNVLIAQNSKMKSCRISLPFIA
jgi:hypothetical protein